MRIIVLGATAVLVACGPYHVRLDPPRPDITPEERVKLFWAMRPTATGTFKEDGTVVSNTIYLGDAKEIDDRIEVESPEDLEPLVGPDSETMQHARASVRARHKASMGEKVTLALLAAAVLAEEGEGDGVEDGRLAGAVGTRDRPQPVFAEVQHRLLAVGQETLQLNAQR
jgi:hypothetical protein